MFNKVAIVGVVAVLGLALFDGWKTTGMMGTSVMAALVATLIAGFSFLVAWYVGKKTDKHLIPRLCASTVCLLALVAYGAYDLGPEMDPEKAQQMHVLFLPAILGIIAVAVMGVGTIAACIQSARRPHA